MTDMVQERRWLLRKAELIIADSDEDSLVNVLAALRTSIIALRRAVDGFTYGKSTQGIHSNSAAASFIRSALNDAEEQFRRFS